MDRIEQKDTWSENKNIVKDKRYESTRSLQKMLIIDGKDKTIQHKLYIYRFDIIR